MIRDDRARRLRAGLFLLGALAVLVGVIFLLGRTQTLFVRRVRLHAAFKNTSGLVPGAAVRLAGVDVGIVEAIHFDPDPTRKQVAVTVAVDRRHLDRIRADSVAKLGSKGLLGDTLIDITLGSPGAARLTDGAELRAQESDGLAEVVASLQEGIVEIRTLSATVQDRVKVLFTDDVARDLGRTLHSAAAITGGIEHGPGLLHALVYDRKIAHDTAAVVEDAHTAAAGLPPLVAELRRTSQDVDNVVAEIQSGHGVLHALVYEKEGAELLQNLTVLSATLRRVGDEVDAGKGTVGALLKDPSVYQDLKTILGNVERNRLLKALIRYTIKKDGLHAP